MTLFLCLKQQHLDIKYMCPVKSDPVTDNHLLDKAVLHCAHTITLTGILPGDPN